MHMGDEEWGEGRWEWGVGNEEWGMGNGKSPYVLELDYVSEYRSDSGLRRTNCSVTEIIVDEPTSKVR